MESRQIAEKLAKAKTAVRKKMRTLREEQYVTREAAREGLQPIIEPLQKVLNIQRFPEKEEEPIKEGIPQSTKFIPSENLAVFPKKGTTALDSVYGPKIWKGELYLGDLPIKSTDNEIIIGNQRFPNTTGLKQLIWRSKPHTFDEKDRAMYKQVLMLTKVHKRKDGQASGVKGINTKTLLNL